MELLPALNAFTVFLAIAAVGFVFLMAVVVFVIYNDLTKVPPPG